VCVGNELFCGAAWKSSPVRPARSRCGGQAQCWQGAAVGSLVEPAAALQDDDELTKLDVLTKFSRTKKSQNGRKEVRWILLPDAEHDPSSSASKLLSFAIYMNPARLLRSVAQLETPSSPCLGCRHFVSRRICSTNKACPDLQAVRSGSGRPVSSSIRGAVRPLGGLAEEVSRRARHTMDAWDCKTWAVEDRSTEEHQWCCHWHHV
jgi:hypothetical protein